MKKLLLLLSLVISITSCDNELRDFDKAEENSLAKEGSFKVTPEEAKQELIDFISEFNASGAKTKSYFGKSIKDIFPICDGSQTRSSEFDEGAIDTLMYAVNFSNNEGFALVAADKRTSPILAIIDEGAFSIDSLTEDKDEGLLSFIDNAIEMEKQDILNYSNSSQTRSLKSNGYTINSEYSPLLHTKWGQDSVYGKYCPNGIAGCVVTATAQILSYYQTIGHVDWSYNNTAGSSDLHWDNIIADCDNNNGKLTASCATSANEIAHLVRYLGIALDADYKKGSTSVGESKAIDWFNKWGNLNASSLKGYNESTIISAIKSGYPVYARGNSGKKKILGVRVGWKGGHAWVYDGTLTATKNGKSNIFIHCNWGWNGSNNGYYLSKTFDTSKGAEIHDSTENQTGSGSNYKYNLEYSIIKRK